MYIRRSDDVLDVFERLMYFKLRPVSTEYIVEMVIRKGFQHTRMC